MVLKIGTKIKQLTPSISTNRRSKEVVLNDFFISRSSNEPFIKDICTKSGTNKQTKLGNMRLFTIPKALIRSPIHNMVVVTSPMGDHAPPALAAITMILAKTRRSSLL